MTMEDKNKLLEEYINSVADETNKRYKGLIDKDRIRELYKKFEDSEDSLQEDIIPEINDIVEKLIEELEDLKRQLEAMMMLREQQELEELRSMNLGGSQEAIYLSEQKLNYMVIGQLESKEDVKKYISNVSSQFPIGAQEIIDNYESIITDEQIEEIKATLSQRYETNLRNNFSNVSLGSPEEARAKLSQIGIKDEELESYVDRISRGETLEVLKELTIKYGPEVIEKINEGKVVTTEKTEEQQKETEEVLEGNTVIFDEYGNRIINKPKTKTLINGNGFGYIATLTAIVSFAVGVISTITYFVVSSIFK